MLSVPCRPRLRPRSGLLRLVFDTAALPNRPPPPLAPESTRNAWDTWRNCGPASRSAAPVALLRFTGAILGQPELMKLLEMRPELGAICLEIADRLRYIAGRFPALSMDRILDQGKGGFASRREGPVAVGVPQGAATFLSPCPRSGQSRASDAKAEFFVSRSALPLRRRAAQASADRFQFRCGCRPDRGRRSA